MDEITTTEAVDEENELELAQGLTKNDVATLAFAGLACYGMYTLLNKSGEKMHAYFATRRARKSIHLVSEENS